MMFKKIIEKINSISDFLYQSIGISYSFQSKFLTSIFTITLLWIIKYLLLKIIYYYNKDIRVRYTWKKISWYAFLIISMVLIGRIWFEGFQSLTTYLGLLSAGVAIAVKDIILNLSGWFFILVKKPFRIGDRIQIGDIRGDVIDIGILNFAIMEIGVWVDADQSTGRVLHVPNSVVWNNKIANYNEGFDFIWNEIKVLVTFESNWKKAKLILSNIIKEYSKDTSEKAAKMILQATKKYLIFYSILTPIVYTSVEDSGVLLTVRYLCEPKQRRKSEHELWEKILEAFSKENDIDLAYPTYRIYRNDIEGNKK